MCSFTETPSSCLLVCFTLAFSFFVISTDRPESVILVCLLKDFPSQNHLSDKNCSMFSQLSFSNHINLVLSTGVNTFTAKVYRTSSLSPQCLLNFKSRRAAVTDTFDKTVHGQLWAALNFAVFILYSIKLSLSIK